MGAGRKNCQDGKRHIRASVTVVRVFVRSFPFLILHIHVIFAVFGFCVLGGVKVLYISYVGKHLFPRGHGCCNIFESDHVHISTYQETV